MAAKLDSLYLFTISFLLMQYSSKCGEQTSTASKSKANIACSYGVKTGQVNPSTMTICSNTDMARFKKPFSINITDKGTVLLFLNFTGRWDAIVFETSLVHGSPVPSGSVISFQASWANSTLSWTLPFHQMDSEFDKTRQYLMNPISDAESKCKDCSVQLHITYKELDDSKSSSKTNKTFTIQRQFRHDLRQLIRIGHLFNITTAPFAPETFIVDLNELKLDEVQLSLNDYSGESICSALIIRKTPQRSMVDSFWQTSAKVVRLTYLSKADIILKKSMSDTGMFFLEFVTMPNDNLCGISVQRIATHGKSTSTILSVLPGSSSYTVPVVMLVLFSIGPPAFVIFMYLLPFLRRNRSRLNTNDQPVEPMDRVTIPIQDEEEQNEASTSAAQLPATDLMHFSETGTSQDDILYDRHGVVNTALDEVETIPSVTTDDTMNTRTTDDTNCIFQHVGYDTGLRLNTVSGLDNSGHGFAWLTFVVSLFLIPAIAQLVSTYYLWRKETGDGDLCYHNFRCARPLGQLRSFNNVISNLPYLIAGLSYIVYSYIKCSHDYKGSGSGTHLSIDISIGMATVFLGVFSALYHVCPSSVFFHFDTAFMHLLLVLCMFKLFALRHALSNPHAAFLLTAIIIIFGAAATAGSKLTWLILAGLHLVCLPFVCLQIYYNGHVDFDMSAVRSAWNSFNHVILDEIRHSHWRPLFTHRLVILIGWNVISFIVSLVVNSIGKVDMSMYLLSILLTDLTLYFLYYLYNKVQSKESIPKLCIIFIFVSIFLWMVSLFLFTRPTSDWSKSAAESRSLNSPCVLLEFFDSHDLWHIFSAAALFSSFIVITTVDDAIKQKTRPKLAIF